MHADEPMQAYHVHFATIIDVLGKHCEQLSNKSSLRVMEWVANYMVGVICNATWQVHSNCVLTRQACLHHVASASFCRHSPLAC